MRGALRRCNRGSVGVLWGQSNANRCGNKSGSAAALGYSLPAGATYWENGGQLLSYTAPHLGPEVGIFHEAITVAGRAGCTLIKRGIDGTSLGAWNSTHSATLIAGAKVLVAGGLRGPRSCSTPGAKPRSRPTT